MRTVLTGLALAACAAATVAIAQEGPRPPRGGMASMQRADSDGDGVISRAEYTAQVDGRFARMDANGNGVLDEGEGARGRRGAMGGGDMPPPPPGAGGTTPPPPPPGTAAGTTRDQFRATAMRRFDRMDANHDGRIDASEMAAMADMHSGGRGGDMPPPPPAPAGN